MVDAHRRSVVQGDAAQEQQVGDLVLSVVVTVLALNFMGDGL